MAPVVAVAPSACAGGCSGSWPLLPWPSPSFRRRADSQCTSRAAAARHRSLADSGRAQPGADAGRTRRLFVVCHRSLSRVCLIGPDDPRERVAYPPRITRNRPIPTALTRLRAESLGRASLALFAGTESPSARSVYPRIVDPVMATFERPWLGAAASGFNAARRSARRDPQRPAGPGLVEPGGRAGV